MSFPRLALLSILCTASVSCRGFDSALAEFDTIAGLDGTGVEPATLLYPENVRRWAASLAPDTGRELPVLAVQSPSAFAREALIDLVERAHGDLLESAQVAHRLLLVVERDRNPLNRIEAMEGIGDLLQALDVDPLDYMRLETRESVIARTGAALDALNRADTFEVDETDPESRSRFVDTLRLLASGALLGPADDRRVLNALIAQARIDRDGELEALTAEALREALANACARLLQVTPRSEDPRLRETATLTLYRVSGPAALPQLLWLMSRADGARFRYPISIREHRTLLRLCSQIGGERFFERFRSGPRIVDYVYDMVVMPGDQFEGVRLIALETLARCLGRPISLDRAWADEWWRQQSLQEDN